jgi:hypothetical protein
MPKMSSSTVPTSSSGAPIGGPLRPDDGRGIPCAQAQAIAERAHRGQIEPSGQPSIAHVRRVAAGVPAFARSVAWLHDVLEWTGVGERELVTAGLAPHELAALRLLTRQPGEADDEGFIAEVRTIALAPDARVPSPGPSSGLTWRIASVIRATPARAGRHRMTGPAASSTSCRRPRHGSADSSAISAAEPVPRMGRCGRGSRPAATARRMIKPSGGPGAWTPGGRASCRRRADPAVPATSATSISAAAGDPPRGAPCDPARSHHLDLLWS